MYEHNALGYRSGLALCLTKVRSSRARCPPTALVYYDVLSVSSRDFQVELRLCMRKITLWFSHQVLHKVACTVADAARSLKEACTFCVAKTKTLIC